MMPTLTSTLMNNVFEIKNVSHSFNHTTEVLKDITFNVEKNQFVTLIGPSGCGKSTLFKIITKLIPNYTGEITINNNPLKNYKESVGYMPQKDLLLPWRTLYKNVVLPLELSKKTIIKEDILKLIQTFGLEGFESNYPHELSGGMKQRTALLRTFLMSSNIVLLDEPFAALDYLTKRKLQDWLLSIYKKMDKTILFITHDIEEAINLSDKIIVLSSLPAQMLKEIDVASINNNSDDPDTLLKFAEIKKNIISLIG